MTACFGLSPEEFPDAVSRSNESTREDRIDIECESRRRLKPPVAAAVCEGLLATDTFRSHQPLEPDERDRHGVAANWLNVPERPYHARRDDSMVN
jgi:hypothetical protein